MSEWRTTTDDGVTITRACAWSPPGCHPVGCGLRVHVKDGVVTKIEGDPEHPVTKGALCVRCLALKDYIYHPDRITKPVKRAREDRGLDKWEETTWDDALDIIEKNAKEIQAKYGPESIVVFGGTGREGNNYYNLLGNAIFDTPNTCYAQGGWSCYGPRMSNTAFMMGGGYPEIDYAQKFWERYDHEGYHVPDVILLWGKEPLKSNPDGLWGHALLEMMDRGSKIIMVDPRITWLGTRCEMVLQLRPGTDAALAMAMLNIMFTEGLYDREWCERWTFGLDEFIERCATMPPEKAAEICGLDVEDIYRAARMYGEAEHSGVIWGLAVDQNPNGAQVGQCLIAMMAITGNLDAPGGTLLGGVDNSYSTYQDDRVAANSVEAEKEEEEVKEANQTQVQMMTGYGFAMENGYLTEERWAKRIGATTYPAVCAIIWTVHPDEFLKTLETGEPYQMHMAMFSSSNPCGPAISNEPNRWCEALKKLDFNFATDLFHNATTMACCEVVLPLASTIEHNAMVITHYGMNASFYGAEQKCVQIGECKSDVEIMLALGQRMHPEFWGRWDNEDDYNDFNGLNGILKWKQLQEKVVIMTEEPYYKYEKGMLRPDGQPGFATITGRLELYANAYENWGDDPLPYYVEPPFGPVSTPELMEEYPFVLTSGARKYSTFHSEQHQIACLREIDPLPDTEINPKDAERLGIQDGDWVKVTTPFGSYKQVAKVTPIIKEGVAHSTHAWWYPEQDPNEPNLYGNFKSNCNVGFPNGYVGKQGFGNLDKCLICKIEKTDNDVTDIKSSADIIRIAGEGKLA